MKKKAKASSGSIIERLAESSQNIKMVCNIPKLVFLSSSLSVRRNLEPDSVQNTPPVSLQWKLAQGFSTLSLNEFFSKSGRPLGIPVHIRKHAGNGKREGGRDCLLQHRPDLCSRPEGHSRGWEEALFCSIRAEEFYVCSEAQKFWNAI